MWIVDPYDIEYTVSFTLIDLFTVSALRLGDSKQILGGSLLC